MEWDENFQLIPQAYENGESNWCLLLMMSQLSTQTMDTGKSGCMRIGL